MACWTITPPASERGDRRQESLGYVGHQQTDRERDGGRQRQAGDCRACHEEHRAGHDRDRRNQPRDAVDLTLQRADLRLHALRQRSDPAQLRAHPGRVHDRLRLPPRAQRASEHKIFRLQH